MHKNGLKLSQSVTSTQQELVLMRMSIKAIRQRINSELDDMIAHINRLLPTEESDIAHRFKNFTKKQWGDYLDGKIKV